MTDNSRVSWIEGMFVNPQHFQQQARYHEHQTEIRVSPLLPFAWGIAGYSINQELLTTGRFALKQIRGIFEDGTCFSIPDDNDHPPPLVIPAATRDVIIGIALPIIQPSATAASITAIDTQTITRYLIKEVEVYDENETHHQPRLIKLSKLRLRYILSTSDMAGLLFIALAKIVEVKIDNSIVLDDDYIPPCLNINASQTLTSYVDEIQGLLGHRASAIASRLSGSGSSIAELSDFLMLQAINRAQPIFQHFTTIDKISPERLFTTIIALTAELCTFTNDNRRPVPFPVYNHRDLSACLLPVIKTLKQSLSTIFEQIAIQLNLEDNAYGIKIAAIESRLITNKASFILTVRANMPADTIIRNVPSQIKIGTVHNIRDLVNSALAGIKTIPLPVAPRGLPYYTGMCYFELDKTSPIWQQIADSGNIAIHVSGNSAELNLGLWAIKN